jgi:hypothetical protein
MLSVGLEIAIRKLDQESAIDDSEALGSLGFDGLDQDILGLAGDPLADWRGDPIDPAHRRAFTENLGEKWPEVGLKEGWHLGEVAAFEEVEEVVPELNDEDFGAAIGDEGLDLRNGVGGGGRGTSRRCLEKRGVAGPGGIRFWKIRTGFLPTGIL